MSPHCVNHGLVHHYFGSKHALLGATMLAIEQEFADSIESIDDPAEMITTVFDGVERSAGP